MELAEPSGTELIRQLNEATERYAEESEKDGVLELRWGFICECGSAHCTRWIELTRAEYASLRRRGAPVLAPEHGGHTE